MEKSSFKSELKTFLLKLDDAFSEKPTINPQKFKELIPKDVLPDESYWKPVEDSLSLMLKSGNFQGIDTVSIMKISNREELTCDQIIAKFVIHISANFTEMFFKEFMVFICLFRKALNDKGALYKMKHGEQIEIIENFCSEKDITVAPEVSNLFIAELYPQYFEKLNKK